MAAYDEQLPPLPPKHTDGPVGHHTPTSLAPIAIGLRPPDDGRGSLPSTPNTPLSPVDGPTKSKKANPLVDLIETERVYVDQLTGIIRKVASAWSKSNLPPPELDAMFRGVEGIFKANRGLLAKLNDIGPNPSSPKALGDLLMRWIEDLEGPYTNYCSKFRTGFDRWSSLAPATRLPSVLAAFSASNPPPLPPDSPPHYHPSEPPLWTLDALFLLPRGRIKYYRKLYGRLLKSTMPGRSDHKLLQGAVEKLDELLALLDQRMELDVAAVQQPAMNHNLGDTEDEVVIDMRARDSTSVSSKQGQFNVARSSGETAQSYDRMSSSTMNMPITDLERRLSTERCLDIFTMKPKQVRLQIAPPSLTFSREILVSADVAIELTPRSTGIPVVHQHGHIFILTDLFLVCERTSVNPDGADMFLLYPPLAGKHLRTSKVADSDAALAVTIMKKETLTIHADSRRTRDLLLKEFDDCISFAANMAKPPPPPMPPLSTIPRPSTYVATPSSGPVSAEPSERSSERSFSPPGSSVGRMASPSSRIASPTSGSMYTEERRWSPPQRSTSRGAEIMQPLAMRPGPPPMLGMSGPQRSPMSPEGRAPGMSPLNAPPSGAPIGDTNERPSLPRNSSEAFGGGVPGMERAESLGGGRPSPSAQMGGPPPPPKGFGPGQIIPGGPGSMGPNGPIPVPGQGPIGPGSFIPPPRSTSAGAGPYGPGRPPPGAALPFIPGGPPGPIPAGPSSQQMGVPPPRPGPNMMIPGPGARSGPPYGPGPGPGPNGVSYPGPGSSNGQNLLRKSSSSSALASQFERNALNAPRPPIPVIPPASFPTNPSLAESVGSLPPPSRPLLPSANNARAASMAGSGGASSSYEDELSPPASPVLQAAQGPTTSAITAQMKCKVFLQQQHAQWKSLGSAKLKLYHESPTNVKQLVVEAEDKKRSTLISTIVLTDGVERVGKTGVAVELSDNGQRTGIVYMLQLRNESSAGGLFDSLLAGSDRAHQ
ncbi:hypothetical protein PUNSTDRAFT_140545 [Punctularia strigosozonata HHB-11173 SS5]|uniref:uncharacterized protein n=1 Tax=Punctularia strigosozonata (strain HHB-11173) TaxID=741275 RepID=UPI000441672D|nr:uncharacterized protein PUNSTDRAFT_140545 [Punctularia strigosozonata HHB-11173 SS5]EIN14200.1 hypothetical protein PUNSTDRAFT_140545 [Punctularia strigosozonata HHB-11173 SS5]